MVREQIEEAASALNHEHDHVYSERIITPFTPGSDSEAQQPEAASVPRCPGVTCFCFWTLVTEFWTTLVATVFGAFVESLINNLTASIARLTS